MFQLTKWYLDVIAADGTAFIGYHARLRWRRLRFDYAADLLALPSAEPTTRWTVRRSAPPRPSADRFRWTCAPLQLRGQWRACAPALHRMLYRERDGEVDWNCIAPRAAAQVQRGDDRIRGIGYVERMRISIPPWRLPLETLLWGRFHAPGHTLTWIEWRGEKPLLLVLHNGCVHDNAHITRDTIDVPAARLQLVMNEHRTIRTAPIVGTIVDALPALAGALPSRFGHAHEHKLVSRGKLTHRGRVAHGWALHEEVKWR